MGHECTKHVKVLTPVAKIWINNAIFVFDVRHQVPEFHDDSLDPWCCTIETCDNTGKYASHIKEPY
jgi:hypothetical protein